MFSFFKKAENFFTPHEKAIIVEAIKYAEKQTSGEVRVFIESKCSYVNAIDRAKEIFENLDMHKTDLQNGVLVYIALKHRQLAIFADKGIYNKVDKSFWQSQLDLMKQKFTNEFFTEGITEVVKSIGNVLKDFFPYQKNDTNELPDEIVFGK